MNNTEVALQYEKYASDEYYNIMKQLNEITRVYGEVHWTIGG